MSEPEQHEASRGHARAWWAIVLLAAATLAVYFNSLWGVFVLDDTRWITNNPALRSLTDLAAGLGATARPVVLLSLAINYWVGELDATGFHVVNVAIHLLAGLTLFGIVRRTLTKRCGGSADWLALAVALLWLVHPLQTQSVTYIIQRSESLMGLFYLLTLYCAIRCGDGGRRYLWAAAATVWCALGMATKEVMVTAPLIVLLYDRTFMAGSFAGALKRRWWLHVSLAGSWAVLWYVLGGVQGLAPVSEAAGFAMTNISEAEYLRTQGGVILHYLRLALWPYPLCLDYRWPLAETPAAFVPQGLVVIALLVAALVASWRRSWLGFVGLWFFLILAPTSSIMPISDAAVEHRMYLPLAAVLVLIVVAAHKLISRSTAPHVKTGTVVLTVTALVLGVVTMQRNRDYHDEVTLWQTALAIAPNNPRVLNRLGYKLHTLGRDTEAEPHFRTALALVQDNANIHNNFANTLQALGKMDEAQHHYEQALEYQPDYADAHSNLGELLRRAGKPIEAVARLREALRINPNFFEAHFNLGITYADLNRHEQALNALRQARQLRPDRIEPLQPLAQILWQQQQYDEAIGCYRQWAQLQPNSAPAHNDLGAALAMLGNEAEAIEHFRRALELRPDYREARNNLDKALQAQQP